MILASLILSEMSMYKKGYESIHDILNNFTSDLNNNKSLVKIILEQTISTFKGRGKAFSGIGDTHISHFVVAGHSVAWSKSLF